MPELINNPQDIQLNEQQEIQQIMGDPPAWIVRWGISLVTIGVTLLLLAAWYVKYPDVIEAPVQLETENPPIRIPAQIGGKIEKLWVSDGQSVKEGALLVTFENSADTTDVERLADFIRSVERTGITSRLDLPDNLELGNLQDSWSSFSESYRAYKYFLRKDRTARKASILREQIRDNQRLVQVLEQRKISLQNKLELTTAKKERSQELYSGGNMSLQDYEAQINEVNDLRRQITDLDSEFINNDITIQQLERSILDLKESRDLSDNSKQLRAEESFQSLKSAVESWKLNFLLKAPIDGQITFTKPLSENEFVQAGDEVMAILPPGNNSGDIKGFAALPFAGAGKAQPGQKVLIRLADFPYQQYGSVEGRVESIAALPQKTGYLIEISLNEGLKTSQNKTEALPFRQQMPGTARIITEERRYLERIIDKLTSALREN